MNLAASTSLEVHEKRNPIAEKSKAWVFSFGYVAFK